MEVGMQILRYALALSLGLGAVGSSACGDDVEDFDLGDQDAGVDLGEDGGPIDVDGGLALVKLSGQVLAFEDELPLAGSVSLSTQGLTPAPSTSITGASFVLDGVLPYSVFSLLAGSPPSYRTTYNVAPAVEVVDVTGARVFVVAESTLSAFATAFGITPQAGKAIVLARLVNAAGQGLAGIPTTAIQLNGAAPASGPYYLDTTKTAQPGAAMTSASGWVVFFDVDPGLVAVTTPMGSTYSFQSPQAPTAGGLATVLQVSAAAGATPLPTNVSFMTQVLPIFSQRGCVACHSGNGPGKDLGGLSLNGGAPKVHSELTVEISPNVANTTRVNKLVPEQSLLLTRPSAETPPDVHPNITFSSPTDADYRTILAWIKEGALNN